MPVAPGGLVTDADMSQATAAVASMSVQDQAGNRLRLIRMLRPFTPGYHAPAFPDHRFVATAANIDAELHRHQLMRRTGHIRDTARKQVAQPHNRPRMIGREHAEHLSRIKRIILAPFGFTVLSPLCRSEKVFQFVRYWLASEVRRVEAANLKGGPAG